MDNKSTSARDSILRGCICIFVTSNPFQDSDFFSGSFKTPTEVASPIHACNADHNAIFHTCRIISSKQCSYIL